MEHKSSHGKSFASLTQRFSGFNERSNGLSNPANDSWLGLTYFGFDARFLAVFFIFPCT
jgi:hypothetical protein